MEWYKKKANIKKYFEFYWGQVLFILQWPVPQYFRLVKIGTILEAIQVLKWGSKRGAKKWIARTVEIIQDYD